MDEERAENVIYWGLRFWYNHPTSNLLAKLRYKWSWQTVRWKKWLGCLSEKVSVSVQSGTGTYHQWHSSGVDIWADTVYSCHEQPGKYQIWKDAKYSGEQGCHPGDWLLVLRQQEIYEEQQSHIQRFEPTTGMPHTKTTVEDKLTRKELHRKSLRCPGGQQLWHK